MTAPPPYLIVDATGYLFRAHHALGDLRTSAGHPAGAIMGTLTMLARLRTRYPTQHTICVMDAGGKTFRDAISDVYKANRPPLPEELGVQIAPLQQFIAAWGLPLLQIPGVEADDVIATLATKVLAADDTTPVVIASTDKDLMQLVNDRVHLYDGMKETEFDPAAVQNKFAVTPAQIADYLALVGDSSDNIRGVEKVGAKTAAKWLGEFGSLDEIIRNAESGYFRGVVGENLRTAIADGVLDLARRLVALKTDVDLPQDDAFAYTIADADVDEWQTLCTRFEFQKLRAFVGSGEAAETETQHRPPPTTITRLPDLVQWIEQIRHAGHVTVRAETRGEMLMQAELVGVALAIGGTSTIGDQTAYIPFLHADDDNAAPQLPEETALPVLQLVLEDAKIGKVLHDGKDAWHIFARRGITLRGILDDTKILAYNLANINDTRLPNLAGSQLQTALTPIKNLVDGKKVRDFSQVAIPTAAAYAGDCAHTTCQLFAHLSPRLADNERKLYTACDRPLMPLLARMEHAGVRIDSAALAATAATMREAMTELEARAYDEAGEKFNLNSPKQLETILFEKLKYPSARKTGSGSRSTDERTLEGLAVDYPLPKIILEYRMLAKLVNTYADKLPQLVAVHSGRLHTTFNQTAVLTGRLSSNSPNLQNIPIRTPEGRRIRQAFIAADGYRLLSVDYSQIELRLMAHIAQDDALCAAFQSGRDIHRQTAAEVFGTPIDAVSNDERRSAKAINFGLIYGMSSYGLARTLDIAQEQAKEYIARYFDRYQKVAAFMDKMREQAKGDRWVETAFGRRILLPPPTHKFQDIGRVAINAPIQGSAADLVKHAMLAVDGWLGENGCRSRIILQVHDELVMEVAEDEEDALRTALPELMRVTELAVPLEVNIAVGSNWDEAH